MSDEALPDPEEQKAKPVQNPSILELTPVKFSFAIKKMISHIDQHGRGFLD